MKFFKSIEAFSGMFGRNVGRKYIRIKKEQVFCIAVAVLFAVGTGLSGDKGFISGDNSILRGNYGEADREYELKVIGLSEGVDKVKLTVGAREYTKEQADQLFERIAERIPEFIAGDNDSLADVRERLRLEKSIPEYGVKLSWYPDDAELISYEGEVRNEELESEKSTFLRLVMSAGEYSAVYNYPVTVKPRVRNEEEMLIKEFEDALNEENMRQISAESLKLPSEFKGHTIEYEREKDYTPLYILILGVAAAITLSFRDRSEEMTRLKKREEELLKDYSEIVSKFMVYMGAGLGIRGTWERMVAAYEAARDAGGEKRAVYEEMRTSLGEFTGGRSESEVILDFGRRCRLRPYIKLCSLLDQNRKNGGRNIRTLLAIEMDEAFAERKNLAKRLGEEAGTKLLVPLFIMLMIVMAIVIIPAMLALN